MKRFGSAQAYWDTVATTYDRDFGDSVTGRVNRRVVWRALDRAFKPGQRVLELNCGTGIDAVHLAARGIRVLACEHLATHGRTGPATWQALRVQTLAIALNSGCSKTRTLAFFPVKVLSTAVFPVSPD